jgi:hypothetical protein
MYWLSTTSNSNTRALVKGAHNFNTHPTSSTPTLTFTTGWLPASHTLA